MAAGATTGVHENDWIIIIVQNYYRRLRLRVVFRRRSISRGEVPNWCPPIWPNPPSSCCKQRHSRFLKWFFQKILLRIELTSWLLPPPPYEMLQRILMLSKLIGSQSSKPRTCLVSFHSNLLLLVLVNVTKKRIDRYKGQLIDKFRYANW